MEVIFSREEEEALKKVAGRNGISASEYVRKAMFRFKPKASQILL